MDDSCDMEVDETDAGLQDKREKVSFSFLKVPKKRKISKPNSNDSIQVNIKQSTDFKDTHNVVTGKPKKPVAQDGSTESHGLHATDKLKKITHKERKILTAKRSKKLAPPEHFCILDTNIFVEHLNDLKKFIAENDNRFYLKFVVTWTVLQELDGLKRLNHNSIQNVCRFINEQIKLGSDFINESVLIESKYSKEIIEEKELYSIQCNDDCILKSCYLCKRKLEEKDKVLLVTDDLNMRNKAAVLAIESYSWSEFKSRFQTKFTYNYASSNHNKIETIDLTETDGGVPISSGHAQQLETNSWNPQVNMQAFNFLENLNSKGVDVSEPAKKRSRKENPTDQIGTKDLKRIQNQPTNDAIKYVVSRKSEEKSSPNWLTFRYKSERKLLELIKKNLIQTYGEQLWDKIFDFDVEKASLKDAIRVLKNGWIGTFSDLFKRNNNTKLLIDTIYVQLDDEANNIEKLIKNVSELVCLMISASKD